MSRSDSARAPDRIELDAGLALAFAVVAEIEVRLSSQNIRPGTVPLAVDSVLVLLPLVPLVWRRTYPFAAAISVTLALFVVGAVLQGSVLFFAGLFPFLIALYSTSALADAPRDRLALLLPVALMTHATVEHELRRAR